MRLNKRIILIGVFLSGDEARLELALKALNKRNVEVVWISAIDFTDSQNELIAPYLKMMVYNSNRSYRVVP